LNTKTKEEIPNVRVVSVFDRKVGLGILSVCDSSVVDWMLEKCTEIIPSFNLETDEVLACRIDRHLTKELKDAVRQRKLRLDTTGKWVLSKQKGDKTKGRLPLSGSDYYNDLFPLYEEEDVNTK